MTMWLGENRSGHTQLPPLALINSRYSRYISVLLKYGVYETSLHRYKHNMHNRNKLKQYNLKTMSPFLPSSPSIHSCTGTADPPSRLSHSPHRTPYIYYIYYLHTTHPTSNLIGSNNLPIPSKCTFKPSFPSYPP